MGSPKPNLPRAVVGRTEAALRCVALPSACSQRPCGRVWIESAWESGRRSRSGSKSIFSLGEWREHTYIHMYLHVCAQMRVHMCMLRCVVLWIHLQIHSVWFMKHIRNWHCVILYCDQAILCMQFVGSCSSITFFMTIILTMIVHRNLSCFSMPGSQKRLWSTPSPEYLPFGQRGRIHKYQAKHCLNVAPNTVLNDFWSNYVKFKKSILP